MNSVMLASLLSLGPVAPGRGVAAGDDAEARAAAEKTLAAAKIGTDGPALLHFLRSHILTDADRAHILQKIRELGDDSFAVREKASVELVKLGPRTIPLLRVALQDRDREIAFRAAVCLRRLERGGRSVEADRPLIMAAIQLSAFRKPAGAAEVLLDLLPSANHEMIVEEIESALVGLAVRDGKPEASLMKALAATEPLRRGVAGVVLLKA